MKIRILTGNIRIRFDENDRISRANFLAGRPFDEGRLPPVNEPDPRFPEWIELESAP